MSELVLGEREGREDGEREGCRELLFFGRGNVGGVPINSFVKKKSKKTRPFFLPPQSLSLSPQGTCPVPPMVRAVYAFPPGHLHLLVRAVCLFPLLHL